MAIFVVEELQSISESSVIRLELRSGDTKTTAIRDTQNSLCLSYVGDTTDQQYEQIQTENVGKLIGTQQTWLQEKRGFC